MSPAEARHRIDAIAASWRRRQALVLAFRGIALALPLVAVAHSATAGTAASLIAILTAIGSALAIAWTLPRPPRADALLVARHLDRTLPALEESATLLVADDPLDPIRRLQRDRALSAFETIEDGGIFPRARWRRGALEVLGGALLALTVLTIVDRFAAVTPRPSASVDTEGERRGQPTPLSPLDGMEILIEPPAYTGLRPSRQTTLAIEAPQGSAVSWAIPLSRPLVDGLSIDLDTGGGETRPFAIEQGALGLSTIAEESSVYRLIGRLGGETVQETEFERLTVLPDELPLLAIVEPAQRLTEIRPDRAAIDFEIEASDDYGLSAAELVVTLALGSGEMVEFRERRYPLEAPRGAREATLRQRFDLRPLELGPTAELYIHVEATDNREPRPNVGRSPTTIIRVAGERQETTDLGEGIPIILPPEYFRSQRQIIIDTEKLIAESPDLDGAEIRRRSEGLADDQRALRMRYGALMGEEFVSGQAVAPGAGEAGDDDHGGAGELPTEDQDSLGRALEALPEGMFHAHDSADIATYFASETRAQLKKVLAEMWDAEGRLRIVDPTGALPYENRALVLLKALQQASRVYVQKVGFDPPPLEADERRLTGELDGIRTRHEELVGPPEPEIERAARNLLGWLSEPARQDSSGADELASILRPPIAHLAVSEPEAADALAALDEVAAGRPPDPTAVERLEATLWRLLPPPEPSPRAPVPGTDDLSSRYRELRAEGDDR